MKSVAVFLDRFGPKGKKTPSDLHLIEFLSLSYLIYEDVGTYCKAEG